MHTTTVRDVMTRDVVTVQPATPYKDLVDLMVGEQISALPVVDRQGTLVGIVTEADLLHRPAHADGPPLVGYGRFTRRRIRDELRKATGLTAGAVMTVPVSTVAADEPLPTVARRFDRTGRRRLCVVEGGRLVGIVSRRDVLRPFLRGDPDICHEVQDAVLGQALHADPGMVRASVANGVVLLTGRLEFQGDVSDAGRLAGRVPGVVAVRNRLDWQWNGSRAEPDPAGSEA
ncbi:MAG TPA: CBS domain-containing protein [Pseudonocardiaceae bacterium]|nr:CBS domain-containing protein [Pseudonocardiaceae bacterium]